MDSDFTNFDARCHGRVPLRGPFRGRTSRKRMGRSTEARDERAQDFQSSPARPSARPDPGSSAENRAVTEFVASAFDRVTTGDNG